MLLFQNSSTLSDLRYHRNNIEEFSGTILSFLFYPRWLTSCIVFSVLDMWV